jgi:hypothetical protein
MERGIRARGQNGGKRTVAHGTRRTKMLNSRLCEILTRSSFCGFIPSEFFTFTRAELPKEQQPIAEWATRRVADHMKNSLYGE